MRFAKILFACGCLLVAMGCGRSSFQCQTHQDCGEGQACIEDRCVSGPSCVEGFCPTGLECFGGICVNAETLSRGCGADGAVCPDGQACIEGVCIPDCVGPIAPIEALAQIKV